MRVQLLGTSAAEGWPGLFCNCRACGRARELGGRNLRTRSGALIDGVLKLDFPPDTYHQTVAQSLNLRNVRSILFTHAHDDHFCPAELQYLHHYFVTEPLPWRISLLGPPAVIDTLRDRLALDELPFDLVALKQWRTVCTAGYHVTPVVARHDPGQLCFNYVIEDASGASLLYATDTGWYSDDTWNHLDRLQLGALVVECTKGPTESAYEGHLSIADVIRFKERLISSGALLPGAPVVATHFSHFGGLMQHELEAVLLPEQIQTGFDGIAFEVAGSG